MGSARLTDSGNLVDVEVTWSESSGDTYTQIYWTVHENGYGRTFCIKAKGGGNQIDQGGTVTVGGSYYLQCFRNGSWYKDLGPFTITVDNASGGGSSAPSYNYATNSISFSGAPYNFGSTGGEITYNRSTNGTGNAPILYVDSKKVATLGAAISAGQSVSESFLTSTYEDNFTVGDHTIELRVSEHTGSSTITSATSASTTVKIYKRPSTPKVTQKIVASSAAGSYLDTPTYDSDSILYYSDNNINWITYSSGDFFTKGKTYYFKASHNITKEDSEILEVIPVIANTAKPITISTVVPEILTAQSLLSNAIYARKVTITVTTSATSYSWYYRAATTIDGLVSAEEKLISTGFNKTQELTINDPSLKMGYYYQVGVSGTDNFGDSSVITWWTSDTYQIAPVPKITALYNYFTGDTSFDTNLAETNRFYTNLTFNFQYNKEITQKNVVIQYRKSEAPSWSSVTPQESNISLGNSTTNGTIKISLPSTLDSDIEYEFRIRYILHGLEIFSNTKDGMYQINKDNIINNLTIYGGQEVFKPYTETDSLELRIARPYENSFKENYTSYDRFQCQIIVNKQIVLLDMLTSNGFKENSNDTVSFFFDKTELYSKLEPLELDKTTSYAAELKLAVNNIFGLPHSGKVNIIIDYRESPIITFNQPKFSSNVVLNSSSIIKEGDQIVFSYKISDYNPEVLRTCIQVNRSDATIPLENAWVDYGQENSLVATGTSGYLKPIEYNSSKEITIAEIVLSKYIFFRLRVTDSSGDKYSDYYNCGRSLQHTAPIIQQLNVTYKEEGNSTRAVNSTISGQLDLIDLGIGLKEVSSLDLIDSVNSTFTFQGTFAEDGNGMNEILGATYSFEELIEKSQQNKNLTFTIPFDFEGQEVNYATLQLKAKTIINYSANGLYSEKVFELSPFIVFNTLQTVSYRKNRLAINVRDFDTNPDYEDAILVIGQADSNKNKIIYSTPSGSGYLVNFIIDGGTWD